MSYQTSLSYIIQWNNDKLVDRCLEALDRRPWDELILVEGNRSQAKAYAWAEKQANGEILVYLHQDTIMSIGWRERFLSIVAGLEDWGIVGVCGLNFNRKTKKLRAMGSYKNLHGSFTLPKPAIQVDSVDAFLYAKKRGQFRIDTRIPGFHGVVEDLCLQSHKAGKPVWVVDAFAEHLSFRPRIQESPDLPEIKKSADYLIKKWGLPLVCGNIVFFSEDRKHIKKWVREPAEPGPYPLQSGTGRWVGKPDEPSPGT